MADEPSLVEKPWGGVLPTSELRLVMARSAPRTSADPPVVAIDEKDPEFLIANARGEPSARHVFVKNMKA